MICIVFFQAVDRWQKCIDNLEGAVSKGMWAAYSGPCPYKVAGRVLLTFVSSPEIRH